MTDDELVLAVRAHVAGRGLPGPASVKDVAGFEQLVGHPMPDLLKRMYLEVANGGFGPKKALSLTDTGHWFSDRADLAMAYQDFAADPGYPPPPGIVPLMDRGCAMWTLIDFRTADGQMWDWDPNLCCLSHALAPLERSLAHWLTDWLRGVMPDGPYPQRELSSRDCPNR
ncbi:SMI1/KNR4 family protein [Streptomyces sp. NPDC005648]|uniref:SMI1/KNR4 family protein n=1 Tax=Streptomyces sp. NPDC005648 TaxID=3157044 RepID=UPI0033AA4D92